VAGDCLEGDVVISWLPVEDSDIAVDDGDVAEDRGGGGTRVREAMCELARRGGIWEQRGDERR
jgi:hypothetical protein